jgi:hypothetical protein
MKRLFAWIDGWSHRRAHQNKEIPPEEVRPLAAQPLDFILNALLVLMAEKSLAHALHGAGPTRPLPRRLTSPG